MIAGKRNLLLSGKRAAVLHQITLTLRPGFKTVASLSQCRFEQRERELRRQGDDRSGDASGA